MGKLFRHQICNVYTISTVLLLPVLMLFFWASQTELWTSWPLIYETAEGPITYVEFLRTWIGLADFMDHVHNGVALLLPFLAVFSCGMFFRLKKGAFVNAMIRSKRSGVFVWKMIAETLMITAAVFYVGYLIVLVYGVLTHTLVTEPQGQNLHNLFCIFGENFWKEHPIVYLLLEGLFRYGFFPATYGLFAIGLSLLTSKAYIYMLLPGLYYFMASFLFGMNGLGRHILFFRLFSPSFGMSWGAWTGMVPFYIPLMSLLPIWIFSFLVVQYWIKKGRLWE